MNTKFRKTAKDDSAILYQKSRDSVTREDIKKLPFKQKLAHFRDYYLKICLLIILCVIFAVYFIYTSCINPAREVLSVIFLNGCYVEDTEGLSDVLKEELAIERKKDQVSVEYLNLEDYQANIGFMTRVGAGSTDIIVCSHSDFEEQAQKGIFADLREYLPQETYSSLADSILSGRIAEMDEQGNVMSYGDEIPFGIELTDSSLCAEYVLSSDTPVLCVSAASSNINNSLKAIQCFVDGS